MDAGSFPGEHHVIGQSTEILIGEIIGGFAELVKRLVGAKLQKVPSVGEKLFDAEREFGIEGVLQFLR